MHADEWNAQDRFAFEILSPLNPFAQGLEALDEILDLVESTGREFRPKHMTLKRRLKYSRKVLRERLDEVTFRGSISFTLGCTHFRDSFFSVSSFLKTTEDAKFGLSLHVNPFAIFREPGKAEERALVLVKLARGFASRFPVSYGFAHSGTDFAMGSDPHLRDSFAPKQVYEAHWLNLYGPRMVEQIGRQRVLSTPAFLLEELPGGAVLFLTRPTPADFASEEARLAQARALVHLRPELKLEDVLAALRQRSLAFSPIEPDFDPDIADLLSLILQRSGLDRKRQDIERLNHYRPPPPSEWLPARDAPSPDVPDVAEAIRLYEYQYAEQLAALLHKEVPSVMDASPESLPQIDYFLWWRGWGPRLPEAERELLIQSLGAYLGMLLVHRLGGRWVPRRSPEEAAVIVGGRAWLPFLRARHHVQSRQAALDCSLTQLFRYAQRFLH
jgi:hypothetical protein